MFIQFDNYDKYADFAIAWGRFQKKNIFFFIKFVDIIY